jgi:hypothetical protein
MATAATSPVFDYASAIKSGYDLWNQNVNAGAAKATAADSAKNWTDQMNGAGTSQSSLSDLISSLGNPNATRANNGALPSSLTSYASLNAGNDTVTPFQNIAGADRANMLSALGLASDAAGRRVNVNSYNTDNVRNRADQKYSSMVGGVDRAATIAASQGFGQALNNGMANSTAAATQSNNLTRDFSDLYAKLREESDSSALAENSAQYKSYLEGQGVQIDQNAKVASALNQTYATTSQKSANADGLYANAANASADRDLAALKNQDAAWLQADSNSNAAVSSQNSLLANLSSIYGNNQSNMVDSAYKRYATDASSAMAAAQAQGTAQSGLLNTMLANPTIRDLLGSLGSGAVDLVSNLVKSGVTKAEDIIASLISRASSPATTPAPSSPGNFVSPYDPADPNYDSSWLDFNQPNTSFPDAYAPADPNYDSSWLDWNQPNMSFPDAYAPADPGYDDSWLNWSN